MKVGPFFFNKVAIGVHRGQIGPPVSSNAQGDLLRELARDYPSLTQIPGGVLFTDAGKGRALIIDQTRVEASENSPNISMETIDRMGDDLRKTMPLVSFPPPYGLRIEGTGTIQALEGLDPVVALKAHAPPDEQWTEIAGPCRYACVRYLFVTDDGGQRDVHVEPLFAQPDKFYVMVVTTTGMPSQTLDNVLTRARQEVDVMERLSDRIVSDIVAQQRA
jgi:hypothetical protein